MSKSRIVYIYMDVGNNDIMVFRTQQAAKNYANRDYNSDELDQDYTQWDYSKGYLERGYERIYEKTIRD